MRARTRSLTWLLAIVCLAALGGCRRVTIISFYADTPVPRTDALIINLHGFAMKRSIELNGMDEQLGLYDVRGGDIDITAFGCAAAPGGSGDYYITSINMMNGQLPPISYPIDSDAVLVRMAPYPGDGQTRCPRVEQDGSVSGEPDAGGAAGTGSGGSNAGGAAGAGSGGMSGSGGTDGGVDAAGGAGAGAGSGGNTGVGGCDDAGHVAVDAGACQAPSGPPMMPNQGTASVACVNYCETIVGASDGGRVLCMDSYPDVATCERYCTLAMLPPSNSGDGDDTLGCRNHYLTMAQGAAGLALTTDCTAAGPSGAGTGSDRSGGCGSGPCATFCRAWAAFCPNAVAADCMATCESPAAAICRFDWLMRATLDERYCDLVAFTSTCIVPGC